MKRSCKKKGRLAVAYGTATFMWFALFLAAPALATPDDPSQTSFYNEAMLEEFATTYANVYFAIGVCSGFLSHQQEAPADPYGPTLANWPDSFKRQMAEIREEGRIESARLARQHHFTFEERAELCRRQLDSANAYLAQVRARYGEEW